MSSPVIPILLSEDAAATVFHAADAALLRLPPPAMLRAALLPLFFLRYAFDE